MGWRGGGGEETPLKSVSSPGAHRGGRSRTPQPHPGRPGPGPLGTLHKVFSDCLGTLWIIVERWNIR
ncbi:hypothetical protein NDU88_005075 [Pleurodeles waltl]|uniref:Uncharacterized protein n=1 Tax=Pleurodeles waltl TaxID=8319 RepID=A0AAV7VIW7_PLEWA|nr:hypothetical protein NDU88_005075 [Pleurodeles waltl]